MYSSEYQFLNCFDVNKHQWRARHESDEAEGMQRRMLNKVHVSKKLPLLWRESDVSCDQGSKTV